MQEGAYLDVAQVTLYVFWIFFACLIFYLRREDKREGYPLDSTASGGGFAHGFPRMPDPKKYLLRSGHIVTLPNTKNDRREGIAARPIAVWPGAPLEPTGNPMIDGVGPGAWADREDVPELNFENVPSIVPLRLAAGSYIEPRDPDPRGMKVIGADNEIGGVVTEVWVDRAEGLIRYMEVDVANAAGTSAGAKHVLVPMQFALVNHKRGRVTVDAILGSQFAAVPLTKSMDHVTKLEEDKICAYFGAGTLYATPSRQEPLI